MRYVLGAVVGALLAYLLFPSDPIVFTEVVVPAPRILEREPEVRQTIVERIRFVTIEPRQAARAPGGAVDFVSSFCRPTVVAASGSSIEREEPATLIRSLVHRPSRIPFRRDELELFGVTSLGDLTDSFYDVRPGFTVVSGGPTIVVRYPRAAVLVELLELGIPLAAGFFGGRATR